METQVKPGKNLMEATWTKAAKVRRAFKAGKKRQKDLVLSPRRAVLEAYSALHELRAAMASAGLAEEDANAALVFLGGEAKHLVTPLPPPEHIPKPYSKARAMEAQGGWIPIGLVLHQQDREAFRPDDPKSGAFLWAQQWVMSDRATRALLMARDVVANTDWSTAIDSRN